MRLRAPLSWSVTMAGESDSLCVMCYVLCVGLIGILLYVIEEVGLIHKCSIKGEKEGEVAPVGHARFFDPTERCMCICVMCICHRYKI
jgi:hypothetical protein